MILIISGDWLGEAIVRRFKTSARAEKWLKKMKKEYNADFSDSTAYEADELEILPDGSLASKEVKDEGLP